MKKTLFLPCTFLCLLALFSCKENDAAELPPDYVSGNKVVIDNETTFVYDESTYNDIAMHNVLGNCEQYPENPAEILGELKPDWASVEYYTIQEINEKMERRWNGYLRYCEKMELDGLCDDVFVNSEKPLKYVYRTVQYVMFDVIYEARYAKGGIHNYDVYLYEDGSAEMVYRHGLEDGKEYIIDTDIRFELSAEELARFEITLGEWDFENIPTWNPEEPMGFDGETTYMMGTDGRDRHLATMWCSTDRYGIYHIRSAMEQIVSEHK